MSLRFFHNAQKPNEYVILGILTLACGHSTTRATCVYNDFGIIDREQITPCAILVLVLLVKDSASHRHVNHFTMTGSAQVLASVKHAATTYIWGMDCKHLMRVLGS